MSDTLLCEDKHLQRKVVVKKLKPGIDKHRLLDELSALASIRSKYVVLVFDVIYDGKDIVGLVEEYIEGPDLKPLASPVTLDAAIPALYPMFAGIAEIHGHNRLHRDLKPENMKYDGTGTLKIFDFGLAKLATNAKTKNLYFSPGYAAPEIFSQDSSGHHNFTTGVDVFALGSVSFWLLNNGKLPMKILKVPPICLAWISGPLALHSRQASFPCWMVLWRQTRRIGQLPRRCAAN